VFSDRIEKQKCCLGPDDIKTVITLLLYNFLIPNLGGCFVTAIATISVIFTFFPLLEHLRANTDSWQVLLKYFWKG